MHSQRACAAQHRAAVVTDQDGEVKDVLLVLSEARAPRQNPCRVVCGLEINGEKRRTNILIRKGGLKKNQP